MKSAKWRVLLQRNFGLFFVGNFLSNVGGFFQSLAQALLIYQMTQSSLAVGVVAFASSVSSLFLGPLAGTVGDRTDRRKVLIWTQIVSLLVAAMQAALVFAGLMDARWLVLSALANGLSSAFAVPVRYSLVPSLVEPEHLQAALQWSSVTFALGRIIGPGLAVLTVNAYGYGWAFLTNAVSFLALIAALLVIVPRPASRPAHRVGFQDLLRLATANRRIALLLVTMLAVVMTYDPMQTLAPAYVAKVLHASNTWVGWFLGGLGVGAIVATAMNTREATQRQVGLMTGLFGAGTLIYILAPSAPIALIGPLIGGAGYLLANTGIQGLLLREAGEAQSGQVMALYSMVFVGARPFIALLDGGLADAWGIRQTGVALALPALAVAAAAVVVLRPKSLRPAPAFTPP